MARSDRPRRTTPEDALRTHASVAQNVDPGLSTSAWKSNYGSNRDGRLLKPPSRDLARRESAAGTVALCRGTGDSVKSP